MRKGPQIPLVFVVAGLSLLLACGGGGSTSNDQPGSNIPPVVNAGVDQSVTEGVSVTLSATASDPDGTIVSYQWVQTSGPSVTLSGSDTAQASFTAPQVTAATPLAFTITVTDNEGATATDSITVTTNDSAPGNHLKIETSRISGIAPLSVHFYTGCSSDSGEDVGFLHNDYTWDFGDPSGGVWGTSGKSKNTAKGGVAAHVFETPGTYVVSLTARDQTGIIGSDTVTITAADPDVVYAGTATTCVSDVNDFSGAPGGARKIVTNDLSTITQYATAGSRILFHRGSSWTTGNLDWPGNGGPVTISAYGAGTNPDALGIYENAPKITVTSGHFLSTNQKQDWRVMDLHLVDPTRTCWGIGGDYERQRVLVMRLKLEGFNDGIIFSHWNTDKLMVSDQVAVVSCDLSDAYDNVMYIGSERLALLGNVIKNARDSHVLRVWQAYRSVISHNTISGASLDSGLGRHALKLHGPGPGSDLGTPTPSTTLLENRTNFVIVSDNVFGSSGPWPVVIGPTSSQWAEELTNVIFERNRIVAGFGAQADKVQVPLHIWASYTTVRNNIIDATGAYADSIGMIIDRDGVEPLPSGVEVYNNTIYRSDSNAIGQRIGIRIGSVVPGAVLKNNLVAFPGMSTNAVLIEDNSKQAETAGNLLSATALFVDADNADPLARDFRLQNGSPGIDQGVTVPVYDDFAGGVRPIGAYDIGAYEHY